MKKFAFWNWNLTQARNYSYMSYRTLTAEVDTWGNQLYMEVEKSGRQTAEVLQVFTVTVSKSADETALGSLTGTFFNFT